MIDKITSMLENDLIINIGIFYKDEYWKDELLSQIIEYYTSKNINYHKISCGCIEITSKNKRILFFNINDAFCGLRLDEIISQPKIDSKIINQIIRKMLK